MITFVLAALLACAVVGLIYCAANYRKLARQMQSVSQHAEHVSRAAQVLRESEDRFRSFFEQSSDGLLLIDNKGTIVEWNQGAELMMGLPRHEVIGQTRWDVIFQLVPGEYKTPEIYERIKSSTLAYIQSHDPPPTSGWVKRPIQRPDGTRRFVSSRVFRIQTCQGTLIGGIVRDVTELSRTEETLAWESSVNAALAELSSTLLTSKSIDDISMMVLEQAKQLTSSVYGYVGYMEPSTGYLISPTMTRDIWDVCQVPDKNIVFQTFGGLWGWVLHNRQPLLTNSPKEDPRSSSTPEGHIPIERFVSVPALIGDTLVGQIALANAARDYTERDVQVLERMAQLYALAIQRQQAENALRQSEERYRLLAENVTDMISRHDQNGIYLYASPACFAILGYMPEELIGHPAGDLVHPDDLEAVRAVFAPYGNATTSMVSTFSFRMRHKDESYIWMETTARRLYHPETNAFHEIIAASRDITERKTIATELEHSLALLRATIESTRDGVVVIACDDNVVTYNSRFRELWNLPDDWSRLPTRLQRTHVLIEQIKHPNEFVRRLSELSGIPDAEGYDFIELHDGRIIEWQSTPYRVSHQIVGRLWNFRDVTDRKRAEAELKCSRTRLKAIFDNAMVGIVMMDGQGHYIEVNDRWVEMLRADHEMVANSTYLDTVLPDDVDESRARLQSLLHGQQADVHMEKLYRRKDGSMFWGDVSACLIHDQPEDTRAIIAIVADITERKRIEEALHHANEQLRHWNSQLERYNRDIMLLNNMSEMLQRCVNEQEAYQVTAEFISHLFSECSGALYRQEHDTVQAVSLWGEQREWVPSFEPQTCEALLRQRIHLPGEDRGIFSCPHIIPASQHHTLCMPITNQHETFGVLCLSSTKLYQEDTRGHTERLAVMISEHLSLTLTNLRLRERLHEQATRDALTGLYNRRYLEEALEYELQKAIRYQRPIGIIMLDIDYFKQFNDTYGHDGGDELLRAVGNFLQRHTRDTDVACRYGGEEFTLILPEATLEDTQRRAEDLCTGIKDLHVQHNGRMLGTITISLGVAGFPRDGRSVATVLRAADLALLQAKTEGRNRLVIARSVG